MTSHYELRLQRDLDWISELVGLVGHQLVETIQAAVQAVLTRDKQLAAETVIGDFTINRQTRELDRLCHAFVARHLPSAGHLRYVSSVLRLNIALERIGDYAATISRTAAQISQPPPSAIARDIEVMAEQAKRTLSDALTSFQNRDVQLAKTTLSTAAKFAPYFDRVFEDLIMEGDENTRPTKDLFDLLATLNRLERVTHQSKNLCEETLFVVTGQAKGEKTFQILFVDAQNDGCSQVAEHFATKAFPNSGSFLSAGWAAAAEIQDDYRTFAETVGLDLSKSWPTDLGTFKNRLDQMDLIVVIGKGSRQHLPRLPFHTTSIEWDLDTSKPPEAIYREITPRIRELMEQLRGEKAN